MQNTSEVTSSQEFEISLHDIVQFIQDSWKQLLAAGIIGAILGFGAWSFFGAYKAEFIFFNNASQHLSNTTNQLNKNATNYTYGLDSIAWRTLQKSLPNLASQILIEERLSSDEKSMYHQMMDSAWWIKAVVPIYAISKADIKDLVGISKELDAAGNTILAFDMSVDGDSSDSAEKNARLAAKFFKSGGAYIQVKSLLNDYEFEVTGEVADIQNQINATEIEQVFLRDRALSLEGLQKRFPASAGINQQVVDLRDVEATAKYLPLATQIIGVNNDINKNKERLIRLNDRLNQISLIKQFLIDALPMAEAEFDGILLSKSLLGIEDKLRKNLSASDLKNIQVLDQLRSQFLTIHTRFTKGLEVISAPATKKTGMLKPVVGGFAGAGFLMLMFLLGRIVLNNLKKDKLSQLS